MGIKVSAAGMPARAMTQADSSPAQGAVQAPTQSPAQTPVQSPTQSPSEPAGVWPPAWGYRAGALDGQAKLNGPAWKAEWAQVASGYQPPAGTAGGDAVAFLKDRVQLDHPRRGLA